MSAVLTKKPGGDYATQLTFPAVFAVQAKANNLASQYYPDAQSRPMDLQKGSGLQADYHEQKRLDANRRCLTGVKDNASSMARYLGSHANYIMPKPVLGQRKYANPSNGNQADIYSSRPIQWNQSMSGGVLRTKEGQEWAIGKLKERIPQLDAMKAAKDAFLMGMPMGPIGVESIGISDITTKVELYGLLTRVESDVEQGLVNNKTVDTSQSLLKLLFAFTPYAENGEVEEIMNKVEYIKQSLDGILEENQEGVSEQSKAGQALMNNAEYLSSIYEKMFQYLTRMNGVMNRPRKEREKASGIFVKSLGFSELEKKSAPMSAKIRREIEAMEAANPNANPEGEEAEEEELMEAESGEPLPVYRMSEGLSSFPVAESAFGPITSKTPHHRPYDEKKEPEFDEDERQVFGKNSGAFLGEENKGKAERSNMESAEMPVEEVEVEAPVFESATAAVSEPVVKPKLNKRPIFVKPVVGSHLTPEEEDNLGKFKNATKNLPEWLNEHSLDSDKLEETKALAKANGYYKRGNATGAELRRALKKLFPGVEYLPFVSRLEKKSLGSK